MSKAAVSVFAVGVFLILTGIGFFIVPNFVLSLLSIPPTDEVWIRILGMIVLFVGYYYVIAARKELKDFFDATISVRIVCFVCFLVLVLTKIAYPILIIFGIIDLIGAIWTTCALRKE
jgi:uncharacterized membrane protein YjjP (DUF1212 family)